MSRSFSRPRSVGIPLVPKGNVRFLYDRKRFEWFG